MNLRNHIGYNGQEQRTERAPQDRKGRTSRNGHTELGYKVTCGVLERSALDVLYPVDHHGPDARTNKEEDGSCDRE